MPNTFACVTCGLTVTRKKPQSTYCSRACMSAGYRLRMSGDGNPAWRGGQWRYKGRGWGVIADGITGQQGSCADCGATDDLIVHHLIPQRFWVALDDANVPDNLVTLCRACHARRPEHYWVTVPDAALRPGVVREAVMRYRQDIRPHPACAVCGQPCKRHRSRFCSYACSNRARWEAGTYGPDLARNITRTRWEAPKVRSDVA